MSKISSEINVEDGVRILAERDMELADIVRRIGPPPLWQREPGYQTLVLIILEQQVSLQSARAVYKKLEKKLDHLSPSSFLKLDDHELRKAGFSRQKAGYVRALSSKVLENGIDLEFKNHASKEVFGSLTSLRGIGPWSASIYMLMALRYPDIWPPGDLALAKAMKDVKHLKQLPSNTEMESIAEGWKPYRSTGARLLWHHYLSR